MFLNNIKILSLPKLKNMKWYVGLIILVSLLIAYLLWERSVKKPINQPTPDPKPESQVDIIEVEVEKK